jgi:hypothetical protein
MGLTAHCEKVVRVAVFIQKYVIVWIRKTMKLPA